MPTSDYDAALRTPMSRRTAAIARPHSGTALNQSPTISPRNLHFFTQATVSVLTRPVIAAWRFAHSLDHLIGVQGSLIRRDFEPEFIVGSATCLSRLGTSVGTRVTSRSKAWMEKPIRSPRQKRVSLERRGTKRQIRPAEGRSGVNIKPSSLISSLLSSLRRCCDAEGGT